MCFGSKETGSRETKLPDWMNDAGEFLVGYGTDLANKPFQAYTDPRVAGFSDDQTNAFQMLRNVISGAPNIGPEVLEGIRTAANAGPQSVGTERLVDEGGRLGAMADYINPYTDARLTPVIRRIEEAADQERKRIGAGATMAGAYGDARHGVREAQLARDKNLAISEAAGTAHADAFDKAMAGRSGDVARFLQTDLANAGYSEAALNRLLGGSTALLAGATGDQDRLLKQVQALLGSGGQQQALGQAGLDAQFQEFLRRYGHDFNIMNALAGVLKSTPTSNTVTESRPDNSGLQLIGSVLAAMI